MAKLFVGTSGFSYDDWVGPFYPKGMKKTEFLSFYASRFSAVEINYTYYRMPSVRTVESMAKSGGGNVRFVFKLHGDMTHQRTAGAEEYRLFLEACRPLIEQGGIGAFLAQFPYSFHSTDRNADYLRRLRDFLPGQDVVVELRNSKWVSPETFSLLRDLGFGYCCVDEPRLPGLMPPVAVATSDIGYVRFHGRNSAKWFEHDRPEERYDYRYSREELAEWVPRIMNLAAMTEKVFCFTNNHFQSKAVESAQILLELLKK